MLTCSHAEQGPSLTSLTRMCCTQGIGSWEAQTMLLLWLSMLALIPFEFSTVETVEDEGEGAK